MLAEIQRGASLKFLAEIDEEAELFLDRCMRAPTVLALLALLSLPLYGGMLTVERDSETGWDIYELTQGDTKATLVPAAGANVVSVIRGGVEYFHQPTKLSDLPGVRAGNPILYPTPNRIRGGAFHYRGKRYVFREGPGNHIHGLVNRAPFTYHSSIVTADSVAVTVALRFDATKEWGRLFPWEHSFRITVTVREGRVRWDYEIDNDASGRTLPFGVAFHPYLLYQGTREQAFLHVPAKALMAAEHQLPNGKLLSLDGHPLDAREPVSLHGYQADDVFYGMTPDKPTTVTFRDVGRHVRFHTSEAFTHLVVWTPNQPFMSIENQTCSTDAHNLSDQGAGEVAHLQECPPGEKRRGWVEYEFD